MNLAATVLAGFAGCAFAFLYCGLLRRQTRTVGATGAPRAALGALLARLILAFLFFRVAVAFGAPALLASAAAFSLTRLALVRLWSPNGAPEPARN